MTARRAARCLLGLVVFLLAWDVWAILVDQRLTTHIDSHTWIPLQVVNGGDWSKLAEYKNPLTGLLSVLMIWLVGLVPLATRLLCVLVHGVVVVQTYDLGRRVGRSREAGLWSALICGTFPMVFGWARMDLPDFIVICPVLAALRLMMTVRMDSPGKALLLGLTLGIGALTKLSFLMYLVGPGLWFIVSRRRDRRLGFHLVLAAGTALVIIAPWVMINATKIFGLAVQSASDSGGTTWGKVTLYLALPGVPILLSAAVPGAAYLLRSRAADRRGLSLIVVYLAAAALQLLLVFDASARYSVALFPAAAILVGASLAALLRRPGDRTRLLLTAAIAGSLLGVFLTLNLQRGESSMHRQYSVGILSPDRGRDDALHRALATIAPPGPEALLIVDDNYTMEHLLLPLAVERFRGAKLRLIRLSQARQRAAAGKRVFVLLVNARHRAPMKLLEAFDDRIPEYRIMKVRYQWLLEQRRRRAVAVHETDFQSMLSTFVIN